MTVRNKKKVKKLMYNLLYTAIGFLMIYPLLWMIGAAFKTNEEIYGSLTILPRKQWVTNAFIEGWKGVGTLSFTTFFANSLKIVVPAVVFTVISSTFVAYGFSRFNFPGKKALFACMISMMMLPNAVLMVPTYILYKNLNWLNTYLPLIVPCLFAGNSFFIFMMIQFFRGIPLELDEAAEIDGCSSFRLLYNILVPMCVPAIVSVALFQFMWRWNDFYNCMIYINNVKKYPVSLGLRLSMDAESGIEWNKVMAMSFVSILPCIILFFCAQNYFIEGIAAGAIKG